MAPERIEIDEDECFSEEEYARALANMTQRRNATRKQPPITQSTKKHTLPVEDNDLPAAKRQNISVLCPPTFDPQIKKERVTSYAHEINLDSSDAQKTLSQNLPDLNNCGPEATSSYSENRQPNPYEGFWRSRGLDCSSCSPRSRSEIGSYQGIYLEGEFDIVTVASDYHNGFNKVNYLGKKELERYRVGKASCLRHCTTIRD